MTGLDWAGQQIISCELLGDYLCYTCLRAERLKVCWNFFGLFYLINFAVFSTR
jgi:hypothetical protein